MTIITVQTTVKVTPQLLAQWFWELDEEAQREFFDELGRVSNEDGSLESQMLFVRARHISGRALRAMEAIGGNSN